MENSVERILQIATEVRAAQSDKRGGQQVQIVWREILRAKDEFVLLSKLGKLAEHISSAASAVLTLDPDQKDSVEHWKNQMLRTLNVQVLNSTCREVFALDPHSINYLKAHARIIKYEAKEPHLTETAIDGIAKNIADSIEILLESDLDTLIKANLSTKMAEILDSIRDYKIYGFPEVFDHVSSLAGQVMLLPENQKAILRNSEASGKIWVVIKVISDVAAATSGLTALGPAIEQLFIGNKS